MNPTKLHAVHFLLVSTLIGVVGCSGETDDSSEADDKTAAEVDDKTAAEVDDQTQAEVDDQTSSEPGDTTAADFCPTAEIDGEWTGPWDDCDEMGAPGLHVCEDNVEGSGPCEGTTLGAFIAAAQTAFPNLEGVDDLYGASWGDGGSGIGIYPFKTEDGFRLVFKQGRGDCPAGCTEGTWTYVESNASCDPEVAGTYDWSDDGCTGEPLWNIPCDEHILRCKE